MRALVCKNHRTINKSNAFWMPWYIINLGFARCMTAVSALTTDTDQTLGFIKERKLNPFTQAYAKTRGAQVLLWGKYEKEQLYEIKGWRLPTTSGRQAWAHVDSYTFAPAPSVHYSSLFILSGLTVSKSQKSASPMQLMSYRPNLAPISTLVGGGSCRGETGLQRTNL